MSTFQHRCAHKKKESLNQVKNIQTGVFCAGKRPKKPFREDVFLKTQRTARARRTAQTFLTISKNRFLEVGASIVSNCPVSAGRLPSHNIFFPRIERFSCHDFFDLQFFSCLQRLLCFVAGRLPPETSMSSLFSFFCAIGCLVSAPARYFRH